MLCFKFVCTVCLGSSFLLITCQCVHAYRCMCIVSGPLRSRLTRSTRTTGTPHTGNCQWFCSYGGVEYWIAGREMGSGLTKISLPRRRGGGGNFKLKPVPRLGLGKFKLRTPTRRRPGPGGLAEYTDVTSSSICLNLNSLN